MKSWIKLYWGNCASVVAIVISIVAICISLPTEKPLGIDYLGVLVGILSLLVTVLVGWQIWGVLSIDKKIKERVDETRNALDKAIEKTKEKVDETRNTLDKAIEKTKEDLAIAGARAATATLYQTDSSSINIYLLAGKNGFKGLLQTLESMYGYAIALNEPKTLSHFAKTLVEVKPTIDSMSIKGEDYEKVCNLFLEYSQTVLTRLPASDVHVRRLLSLIDSLKNQNKGSENR